MKSFCLDDIAISIMIVSVCGLERTTPLDRVDHLEAKIPNCKDNKHYLLLLVFKIYTFHSFSDLIAQKRNSLLKIPSLLESDTTTRWLYKIITVPPLKLV